MNHDLEAMAGTIFAEPDATERNVCVKALKPIVLQLMQRGMQPASIVSALAELSLLTLDHRR